MARNFMSGKYTCEYCGNPIEDAGVHNGSVIVKERFCSPKCKIAFNNSKTDRNGENSSNSETSSSAKVAGTTAGIVGGAVGGAIGGLGNVAGKGFKGLMDMANLNYKDQLDQVTKMEFSEEKGDLSNQLNELVTIAGGTNAKPLKKGIYEKMEYGIMKLNSIGATSEADFFETKRKKIKPKWYE